MRLANGSVGVVTGMARRRGAHARPFAESRWEARARLLAVLAVLVAGCGQQEIEGTYGRRRGADGEASVNGTSVLARMCELAGAKVQSRSYLSPSADNFDVIVWFPDDFKPPSDEPLKFLEEWLYRGRGKTLIYVGRDYDAASDYWQKVLPGVPPEQGVEVLRRLAQARAQHARARSATPDAKDGRWFRVRGDAPRVYVGRRQETTAPLRGPWAADGRLQPSELDLVVDARLEPLKYPPQDDYGGQLSSEIWLAAGSVPLVWQITNPYWNDGPNNGQIIVVNNGAFLLNLPLVEYEHRKLAGKLIAACGPDPEKVLFLESGAGGVSVHEEEPGASYPTGFEAFTVWPLNAILLHFVFLGLIVLACRWTVFGRPRQLPRPPVSDFGDHVEAVADLLARTQDHAYAQNRLAEYRRPAGAERLATGPAPVATRPANDRG